MKFTKYFFLGFLLICFFSCQNTEENTSKLKVLSSFSILTELIQEIGGDRVEVHNLVPIGMAPHVYEPKPEDVIFASKADVLIYNGLNLEGGEHGWLMKLAKSVKIPENRIFVATIGVKPMYLIGDNNDKEINPHAFISPKSGEIMVKNICLYLSEVDPKNKGYYSQNLNEYLGNLYTVEKEYTETFQKIPKEKRIFVASEQAFQYFARDYDLKEGYIWAIDTEKNGTPQQIKQLIHFIEKYKPSVLFVESNKDPRPMEVVSKSTGVPINNKPIFSDELGRKGHPADSYLKYLKYNLDVISNGLMK